METRNSCLATIISQCQFIEGFEELFTHLNIWTLTALASMIEEHTFMRVCGYNEYVDFLDGNGFSVVPDGHNWYVITPLNT